MDQNKDNSNDKKSRRQSNNKKEEDVNKLVQSAMQSHLLEYADRKNAKKKSIDEVSDIVKEHLGSFIILGYNYNGDSISSVVTNTQQEADSLCTLINRFLIHNTSV